MKRPNQIEIDRYLEKMDDLVDSWHNSESELELHQHMDLSWTEYAYFVEHPRSFAHSQLMQELNDLL